MSQTTADPLSAALDHHRAGRLTLAERLYRQILLQHPNHADAWHLLGALCLQSARPAEAVDLISRAIEIRPDNADYYSHLGAAYGSLDKHDEAVASLRRAVQIAPQSAGAHYNLGTALRNQGKLVEAVASFRHALAANPNSPETHYNLANTLGELDQFDEAEASYRDALRVRPDYVKAMINLGSLLRDRKRLGEALEVLRAAVAAEPNYANAHLNLGTVLRDAGQFAEAEACLRRAVSIEPNTAEAHNNLATVLQAQARFDEALGCYDEALRLDPELAEAHFTRAMHRLRAGDLAGGFAEYEWRWKCKTFSQRTFGVARWDGGPLAGRTILLHAEQGLGDTLQFIRYAARVKESGGTVLVECPQPLVTLLAGTAGVDQLVAAGQPLPRFDVECPLLSLPGVLGLSEESLGGEPHLFADVRLVERWRQTLAGDERLRVGVCWQGNSQFMFDAQRSFPLALLAPLARVPGVRLISLQKGPGSEQLAGSPFKVFDLGEFDEAAGPFMDTAAVIKNLDLVITSDTATAHLAGGLGASVWVALSAHCDWRWFFDRQDTPWYPTMRLFRQRRLDQWDDVFERMAAELRAIVTERG